MDSFKKKKSVVCKAKVGREPDCLRQRKQIAMATGTVQLKTQGKNSSKDHGGNR